MINEILARFISLANVLIPKRNIIYLFSTMAYKDNIQAVLEEIINSNINNNYTIVCDGPGFDLYKGKNIIHVKHLTLYSLYMFLRSKFIIYDIGIYGQIKGGKNQVLINTWHGTSLKKIEYYLEKNRRKGMPPLCTYSIAYSDFYKPIIQKAFGLDVHSVFITGEPRNDYFFQKDSAKILEKLEINNIGKKVLIWMPTWRYNRINNENDGGTYPLGIPFLNSNNLEELNRSCGDCNVLLIIKWHGLQSSVKIEKNKYKNIRFLTSEEVGKTNMALYCLVACCDGLITDYSSIYVNYLILNRPICFAYDDMDEYITKRGFMFDDVKRIMPGVHVQTFEELIYFIKDFAQGKDAYRKERTKVNMILNSYSDNNNSYRLLKAVGIIK